jgi:hypothetical protein
MKVLMVSRQFPAYHPKAGQPTGFIDRIISGRKLHTLRENKTGKFKNDDTVSLRYWADKPYRSKQIEFAQATISVTVMILAYVSKDIPMIADDDGLCTNDFVNWFGGYDKVNDWEGSCIWFKDIKPTTINA